MIPINDLTRGIAQSEDAADAITRVLKSGYWIQGPEQVAFESEFAEFLNVDHVFGVASGTDALELALRAVGCKRGSKVITVANAGGYTSVAAATIGCEVIYCDVDPDGLLMDPEALKPLLSKEISVVVVTHLYGNVAPVSLIKDLCDQFEISIVEDCAQATGASERGIRVGTIGNVGTFSFYPTKNLGGIGDGGALATNDSEIAQRITQLRQYGWTSKYRIEIPGGMNSRLDEIQAAVLRIGLKHLDSRNQNRIEIIEKYSNAIKDSGLKLVTSARYGNVAHLAVLRLPEALDRDDFRSYMRELGIQTEIHYPILDCNQSGLAPTLGLNSLVNSRHSVGQIVSIPLFPELDADEVKILYEALRNSLV
jgi:dTDP-3-amino-2,3,6-trideoxy-4-keto-D-glucose/dTDP-3-amino-3,4,6-trideoxy-alpha-D-glucose/dTDP-2,6-dideoxy-D-kanosamine transaminase